MKKDPDSALALLERMERKAPEYFDLLKATSEAEFEAAFVSLLEKALTKLETNRKNYADLDEVGLSGVLAAALSMPGLTVQQESHSNGHVDLTIEADHCVPARRKLGEAKIYRGPAYHFKGLEQLIGRYTTGRELGGLLLVYVREEGIVERISKLRAAMDTDKPCAQIGPTRAHVLKWAFSSTHTLTSGDDHEVSHVGCNLCPT